MPLGSVLSRQRVLGKTARAAQAATMAVVGRRGVPRRGKFRLIGMQTSDRQAFNQHLVEGFPRRLGKTNLSMMLAPPTRRRRYHVGFHGDDIAVVRVDHPDDGIDYRESTRVRRRVRPSRRTPTMVTNPTALASVAREPARVTNVSHKKDEKNGGCCLGWGERRGEGQHTPEPPPEATASVDWMGPAPITIRAGSTRNPATRGPHTNSSVHHDAGAHACRTSRSRTRRPEGGVPIDAISAAVPRSGT